MVGHSESILDMADSDDSANWLPSCKQYTKQQPRVVYDSLFCAQVGGRILTVLSERLPKL